MKKLVYIISIGIIVCMMVGCEASWREEARQHQCTDEEMVKVRRDAEYCNKHTSDTSTYCYHLAIIMNCRECDCSNEKEIEVKKDNKDQRRSPYIGGGAGPRNTLKDEY